jgi:hypothetical protein
MRNEDLPEGPWAVLAPALLLPCVVVCMLSPRIGGLVMVVLSVVSSIALAMWIYRVGWLDGFAILVMVLPMIAGIGLTFWRTALPAQTAMRG